MTSKPVNHRAQTAVFALLGIAVVLVAVGQVRMGVYTLSAALMVAAALRWFLPAQAVGLLASRRRVTDVVASGLLGLALAAVGYLLPQ